MNLLVILVVAQFWFVLGSSLQENDPCITPCNQPGKCIPSRNCKYVLDIVRSSKSTYEDQLYLEQSQCGVTISGSRRTVLTCCPQLLNPKDCGAVDFSERLLIGELLKEQPWAGLLVYDIVGNNSFEPKCGASLLNSRFVLTAAHCIRDIPRRWTLRRVRFSEWDTTSYQCYKTFYDNEEVCRQEYDIEKVIVHPNYSVQNRNKLHDIALLKTDKEVSFSKYVRPLCLPLAEVVRGMPFEDEDFTVTGWGQGLTDTWIRRGDLFHANVVGKTNDLCDSAFSQANVTLADTQLCAVAESDSDYCKSASGGPLMLLVGTVWHQVGIRSFDHRHCAEKGVPVVFTNVAKYLDWIEAVVNESHCELSEQFRMV